MDLGYNTYQNLVKDFKNSGHTAADSLKTYPYTFIVNKKNIIRHKVKNNNFYSIWEVLKNFDIIDDDKILDIYSNDDGFIEACKYYSLKYTNHKNNYSEQSNYDLMYQTDNFNIPSKLRSEGTLIINLTEGIVNTKSANKLFKLKAHFRGSVYLYYSEIDNLYYPDIMYIICNNKRNKAGKIKENYRTIIDFNNEWYNAKIININKLLKGLSIRKSTKIMESVIWANKYDLRVVPYVQTAFNSNFGRNLINFEYKYYQPLNYKFHKKKNGKLIKLPIKQLEQLYRETYITTTAIDTVPLQLWDKIKIKIRFYMPRRHSFSRDMRLTTMIMKQFNTGKITQAWLKMYEILDTYHEKLFNNNNKSIKSFHICEAPGNFIAALNHFVKTRTSIKELDWCAQSLKPTKELQTTNTAFGDSYGYIKKYKNRWDLGPKNSGDITDIDNFKHYTKLASKAQLITGDCGAPYEFDLQSLLLTKLGVFEMCIILFANKLHSSFIIKVIQHTINKPLCIGLLYLLYKQYKYLYFYKPVVNPYSSEFYCIGIDRQELLKKSDKVRLYKLLKNYNTETPKTLLCNKYDKYFMNQFIDGLTELHNLFTFAIDRQLYYVNNIDIIKQEHLDSFEKKVEEKNNKWIKRHNVKSISDEDRL